MSELKYTKVAEVDTDGYYDGEGQPISGFVTVAVNRTGTFDEAVRALVRKETGRSEYVAVPPVLMTTRDHWSGYSEYTITNTWSEIILTVVDWNWEHEWPSLGDFLRAMADANPEADR